MGKSYFDIAKRIYEPVEDTERYNSSEGPVKNFNDKFKPFLNKLYRINICLLQKSHDKESDENSTSFNLPYNLEVNTLTDETFDFFCNKIEEITEQYGFHNLNTWIKTKKIPIDNCFSHCFSGTDEDKIISHMQFIVKLRFSLLQIVVKENLIAKDVHYYNVLWSMRSNYFSLQQKIAKDIRRKKNGIYEQKTFDFILSEKKFYYIYLKCSIQKGRNLFPKESGTINTFSMIEHDKIKEGTLYECISAYKENPNQNIDELIRRTEKEQTAYFNELSLEEYNT